MALSLPSTASLESAGPLDDLVWPQIGSLGPKNDSKDGGNGPPKHSLNPPSGLSDASGAPSVGGFSFCDSGTPKLPHFGPISSVDAVETTKGVVVKACNEDSSEGREASGNTARPSGSSDGGRIGEDEASSDAAKYLVESPKNGTKSTRPIFVQSRAPKDLSKGKIAAKNLLESHLTTNRQHTKPPGPVPVPSTPALGKILANNGYLIPTEPYSPFAGLSFLPSQSQEYCRRTGGSFCIMVAGAAGTGKTTFLDTLFHTSLDPPEDDQKDVRVARYLLVENGFPLTLTCVDTPQYGITLDNHLAWLPLTRYLDEQFRAYVFQSEQPDRTARVDLRVHVCLYFLSPSEDALTPLDIESMRELSKRVNFIPVIGKCDSLNKEEVEDLKKSIRQTLQKEEIQVCHLIADTALAKKITDIAPFAVMGSNAIFEDAMGKKVRGRKYRWGLAEVENEDHCDFLALRLVLVEDHMLDLIASTEAHYDLFRSECLAARASLASKDLPKESKALVVSQGYEELMSYHKVPFQSVEYLSEDDPLLEYKKMELKKAFFKKVQNQESRFRDWKQALVSKQEELNNDLARDEQRLQQLQAETNTFLESQSRVQEFAQSTVSDEDDSDFEYFSTTRDMRPYRRPFTSLSELDSSVGS